MLLGVAPLGTQPLATGLRGEPLPPITATASVALGLGVSATGALAITASASAALGLGVAAAASLAITGSATAAFGLGVSATGGVPTAIAIRVVDASKRVVTVVQHSMFPR